MTGWTHNLVPILSRLLTLAEAAGKSVESDKPRPNWFETKYAEFSDWFRGELGPPLKSVQKPIDDWLGTAPMSVAMACAVGLFVVALIWTWALNRDFIFRGAPDDAWWRDLRIWATLVVIPYVTVYLLLGR